MQTETVTFDNDIKVLYITASSFPDGVLEAHQSLHKLVPYTEDRKYFGISRPEKGEITYRAGMEEKEPSEAEKFNLDTMVLKKGKYVSVTIPDFMKDIPAIGRTFQELLTHTDLDPNGYCVEWYMGQKDVKCMIRLDE